MRPPRLSLTHVLPQLVVVVAAGCSASHEIEAVGAAGAPACVAYFLALDYGSSITVHRSTGAGPVDPIEIALSDPMRGDRYFSAVTRVDVDGDGLRDVVVRDAYAGAALLDEPVSLTWIRGSAAPFEDRPRERFVGAVDRPAGGGISAIGDWNGDGVSDLAAAYDGTIILGGDPLRETEGVCARGVGVGDIDGDGTEDTACDTEGAGVEVRLGGTASPGVVAIPFDTPIMAQVPAGDLNGDGRPELLVKLRDTWTMLDFAVGTRLEISDEIRSVSPTGDIDGDGIDDFVARRANGYHLWRGSATGPVEDAEPFSVVGDGERSVSSAGDANCDGFADVLVRDHGAGSPDRVSLHLGQPEGVSAIPAWGVDVPRGSFVPIYD